MNEKKPDKEEELHVNFTRKKATCKNWAFKLFIFGLIGLSFS